MSSRAMGLFDAKEQELDSITFRVAAAKHLTGLGGELSYIIVVRVLFGIPRPPHSRRCPGGLLTAPQPC